MDFVAFRVHFLDVVVPFAACACILVEPVARQAGQRQRCGIRRRVRADRQLHGAVRQDRRVHVRFQRAQQGRVAFVLGKTSAVTLFAPDLQVHDGIADIQRQFAFAACGEIRLLELLGDF